MKKSVHDNFFLKSLWNKKKNKKQDKVVQEKAIIGQNN